MTTDLWMLLFALLLYWVLIMIPATAKIMVNGVPWGAGNREIDVEPAPGWGAPTASSRILLENLPIFVALVLVTHVSGTADANTALGARVFVGFRVIHAGFYLAGVPWLRTVSWCGSIVGLCLIVYGIVT